MREAAAEDVKTGSDWLPGLAFLNVVMPHPILCGHEPMLVGSDRVKFKAYGCRVSDHDILRIVSIL